MYMLCCFALFVCLTLLASFFLPSHLSFKNMYIRGICLPEIKVSCKLGLQSLEGWVLSGSLSPFGQCFVREWPPTPSPSCTTAATPGLFQTNAERADQSPYKLEHVWWNLCIGNWVVGEIMSENCKKNPQKRRLLCGKDNG